MSKSSTRNENRSEAGMSTNSNMSGKFHNYAFVYIYIDKYNDRHIILIITLKY